MAVIIIIVLVLLVRRWRLDKRTQKVLNRIEAKTDRALGALGVGLEEN